MLSRILAVAVAAFAACVLCTTAGAAAPIQTHAHLHRLQKLVDSRYGRGCIDVTRDYIGARLGDPDPWVWVSSGFAACLVRSPAGHGRHDTIGWYEESGVRPVGPCGGVVFAGGTRKGSTVTVDFGRLQRYGFFVRGGEGDDDDGTAPLLFTNPTFNNPELIGGGGSGPRGTGYPAALVFDVSSCSQARTWLVCFTDRTSKDRTSSDDDEDRVGDDPDVRDDGRDGRDEDHDDFDDGPDYSAAVFEVTSSEVTPVRAPSFGSLKSLYRH